MANKYYTDSAGNLVQDDHDAEILVRGVAERDQLRTKYPALRPGTVAYTAGCKQMWQLNADGQWIDMMA